ncbi:uncharacterized protein PGTG_20966 [Puccinia graminis f. sp. tritici CRL 75-36-700-3]|uniref:Uncharacterized protein n=1 Tax=Puccinia graminis f. sp. tritici (strain CRL 75-36-700-3 / race SCCL) TaxID=418459 RepID=H6QQ20_PUCGT|nr:uncharacterized protein PGTG_20966 [Puccinia graminis f. sp. tritici CRL 75-36-700-3]EHS64503.1 hypothetical protein PGTG_20966 [Puccinia graminis f. sp. tritici CRL 75-36-700-3]
MADCVRPGAALSSPASMERQHATPRRLGSAGRAAEAEVGLPLNRLKPLHCGDAVSPSALAGAAESWLDGTRPQASSFQLPLPRQATRPPS